MDLRLGHAMVLQQALTGRSRSRGGIVRPTLDHDGEPGPRMWAARNDAAEGTIDACEPGREDVGEDCGTRAKLRCSASVLVTKP